MQDPRRSLGRFIPRSRMLTDPNELTLYDADGLTLHRGVAGGVVLAISAREVQQCVQVFHECGVPYVARGAGTGLSGGAVPQNGAWIIDVNRMRAIREINALDRYAVVEPGVINLELDQAASAHGLRYAPDPSSQKACTLGGNVAENSGGPHCFLHGMTTRHVLGMTVVLPGGRVATFGGPPGTGLDVDWRGVFIGAEGTLGITVEIVVSLIPRPEHVRTALASFSTLPASCRAVASIIRSGVRPAALEILDHLTIRAVEASVFRAGYPERAEAVLLIEQEGTRVEIDDESGIIESACRNEGALRFEMAQSAQDRERLWRGRKGAFGAMGRIDRDLYVLDGVVPRRRLAEVVEAIQSIGRKHEVRLSNVFHAGDGNLHPNISFDATDDEQRKRVLAASAEILELCVEVGGSLSGEHGIGLEKRDFMPLVFNSDDLATQAALRDAVDPQHLSNPDKVLPTGRGCVEAGFRGHAHARRVKEVLG